MNNKKKEENKNYYINVADWMIEFDLPTNLLLTYAIVYGYCQSGDNCYFGSTETMAELLGIKSGGHAAEYLNKLEEKKLLKKEFVKVQGKQKMCKYYVTTDRKGKVESQNVDYINIQPWMFKDLNLRNNKLLIYARIQNLSKAGNPYFLNIEDLAGWVSCENRRIRGYINELLKENLIEQLELGINEGYKAIIPNKIKDSKKWRTTPKSGGPLDDENPNSGEPTPNNGGLTPKSGDNNLSYNLYDNNINNNTFINNNIDNIYTQENETVVEKINYEISKLTDLTEKEKLILSLKKENDKKLLERYSKTKFNLSRIMESIAMKRFRYSIAYETIDNFSKQGEELLFNTLSLRRYFDKFKIIDSLSYDTIENLFSEACRLYDEEEPKNEKILDRNAYFIGIVDNILAV